MIDISFYLDRPREFKCKKSGDLLTFSYVHSGIDFNDYRARLARGLTTDMNGNVVLVGFSKFFCHNQLNSYDTYSCDFIKEYSQLNDTGNPITCYEKLDGSLIILGVYKHKLISGTTSSVSNEYTAKANAFFNALDNSGELIEYLERNNSCLVFEYISPSNQIAVHYDYEQYVLLAEVSKEDFSITVSHDMKNTFGFELPKVYTLKFSEIEHIQKTAYNFEGFVAINSYGHLIKLKTDWWYNHKSRASIFFGDKITKKKLEALYAAIKLNEIDDLIARENSSEYYMKNGFCKKVYDEYLTATSEVERLRGSYSDRKALANSDEPYRWLTLACWEEVSDKAILSHLKKKFL